MSDGGTDAGTLKAGIDLTYGAESDPLIWAVAGPPTSHQVTFGGPLRVDACPARAA
jgi:hypothetical protein